MTMHSNISVGKYLVSPMTRELSDGSFAASVSIRSGEGRGTHDRIMRFVDVFRSRATAAAYATREGLQWVGSRSQPSPVSLRTD